MRVNSSGLETGWFFPGKSRILLPYDFLSLFVFSPVTGFFLSTVFAMLSRP